MSGHKPAAEQYGKPTQAEWDKAAGERVAHYLAWLDENPQILPSPEEAAEGLILRDIIQKAGHEE